MGLGIGFPIRVGRRPPVAVTGGGGVWSQRASVSIDNTSNASTLTNYQVKVSVTYAAQMKVDFADIRFLDTDGVTQLSHWLESKTNSTSAIYWVKVPSISASSSKTIYMDYGNPAASSASSGVNTMEFFDDFEVTTTLTNDIADISTLAQSQSVTLTTGDRGFSCVLTDTDGHIVLHSTNKTWLYTNNKNVDGVTWQTYVREYNLDALTVDTESMVKDVDSGRSWANAHVVMELSASLYVMFYTSNIEAGARSVRAATCTTPNGTFVRDTGFEITAAESWENLLEVWPGWIKLSDDGTNIVGWLGYASYDATPDEYMGWAKVSINKSTGASTLVEKKSTNPMSHLLISGHDRAYNGGILDSSVRVNGHYPIFYHLNGPYGIGYAESSSQTHEAADLVLKREFHNYVDLAEIFTMYIWNGKFHLLMEYYDGAWKTVLQVYTAALSGGNRWLDESQISAAITNTAGILTLKSGDTGGNSKDARLRSQATWTGNVALRTRVKGATVGGQLNGYWGLGNSYRTGSPDDIALNNLNIGNYYWANFHDGTGSGFSNTTFTNDTFYIADIGVLPTTTRFYKDDSFVGEKTTQLPVGNLSVRLEEVTGGNLSFDWVAVRKFAYPEPTASVA